MHVNILLLSLVYITDTQLGRFPAFAELKIGHAMFTSSNNHSRTVRIAVFSAICLFVIVCGIGIFLWSRPVHIQTTPLPYPLPASGLISDLVRASERVQLDGKVELRPGVYRISDRDDVTIRVDTATKVQLVVDASPKFHSEGISLRFNEPTKVRCEPAVVLYKGDVQVGALDAIEGVIDSSDIVSEARLNLLTLLGSSLARGMFGPPPRTDPLSRLVENAKLNTVSVQLREGSHINLQADRTLVLGKDGSFELSNIIMSNGHVLAEVELNLHIAQGSQISLSDAVIEPRFGSIKGNGSYTRNGTRESFRASKDAPTALLIRDAVVSNHGRPLASLERLASAITVLDWSVDGNTRSLQVDGDGSFLGRLDNATASGGAFSCNSASASVRWSLKDAASSAATFSVDINSISVKDWTLKYEGSALSVTMLGSTAQLADAVVRKFSDIRLRLDSASIRPRSVTVVNNDLTLSVLLGNGTEFIFSDTQLSAPAHNPTAIHNGTIKIKGVLPHVNMNANGRRILLENTMADLELTIGNVERLTGELACSYDAGNLYQQVNTLLGNAANYNFDGLSVENIEVGTLSRGTRNILGIPFLSTSTITTQGTIHAVFKIDTLNRKAGGVQSEVTMPDFVILARLKDARDEAGQFRLYIPQITARYDIATGRAVLDGTATLVNRNAVCVWTRGQTVGYRPSSRGVSPIRARAWVYAQPFEASISLSAVLQHHNDGRLTVTLERLAPDNQSALQLRAETRNAGGVSGSGRLSPLDAERARVRIGLGPFTYTVNRANPIRKARDSVIGHQIILHRF